MRYLRLLIITLAVVCVLALAAFALVTSPPLVPGDDDIIIKGGSMEIECGKNHGKDCLGGNENKVKYKHKQDTKHITQITVKPVNGNDNQAFYRGTFDNSNRPEIDITYK